MTRILPCVFRWQLVDVVDEDGEVHRRKAMVPLPCYDNLAARQYRDGEEHPMVILEPRSRASHSQYFASISDAFDNLPEDLAGIAAQLGIKTMSPGGFTDPEHLRKWALCETGWCEIAEFDFDAKEEATRLAKFYRRQDSFASITVRGGTHVTIKTPVSQSAAAMDKEAFEKSKRDVLDLLASIIGVARVQLEREAGRAA